MNRFLATNFISLIDVCLNSDTYRTQSAVTRTFTETQINCSELLKCQCLKGWLRVHVSLCTSVIIYAITHIRFVDKHLNII